MDLIQEKNYIKIDETGLGLKKGEVLLTHISGIESMSKSFEYTIKIMSIYNDLVERNLLGRFIKCTLDANGSETKLVTGYISSIEYVNNDQYHSRLNKIHHYSIQLTSWLGIIDKSSDCRVFTNETLEKIIQNVLTKYPPLISHTIISFSPAAKNTKIPMCVQYDESDGHFISRIIEECGFYFYFKHENDCHVLNVFDSRVGYLRDKKLLDLELKVNFLEIDKTPRKSLQVQKITHSNYSAQYKDPINTSSKNLENSNNKNIALNIYKHYETNYAHKEPSVENEIAATILDSSQKICTGMTTNFNFSIAKIFTTSSESHKHLVITQLSFIAGLTQKPRIYFQSQDENISYKSCFYPRQKMHGIHRAVVVGNVHGTTESKDNTVPIKFYWDSYNIKHKNSTANAYYAPISQAFAGKDHGWHLLPHVGDDVIVSFAGGDPNHPIIIGSVYTKANSSKVDKNSDPTVHTFYTVGKNGFSFDDKENAQRVDVVAQKDLSLKANNAASHEQKSLSVKTTEEAHHTQKKIISNTQDEEIHQIGMGLKIKKCKDGTIDVNDGSMVTKFSAAKTSIKFKGMASIEAKNFSFSKGGKA